MEETSSLKELALNFLTKVSQVVIDVLELQRASALLVIEKLVWIRDAVETLLWSKAAPDHEPVYSWI